MNRVPRPTLRDTETGWNSNFQFIKYLKKTIELKYGETISEEDLDIVIHYLVSSNYLLESKL